MTTTARAELMIVRCAFSIFVLSPAAVNHRIPPQMRKIKKAIPRSPRTALKRFQTMTGIFVLTLPYPAAVAVGPRPVSIARSVSEEMLIGRGKEPLPFRQAPGGSKDRQTGGAG